MGDPLPNSRAGLVGAALGDLDHLLGAIEEQHHLLPKGRR